MCIDAEAKQSRWQTAQWLLAQLPEQRLRKNVVSFSRSVDLRL